MELVKLLESPSHRTRLEAQRTLLRRGLKKEIIAAISEIARNGMVPDACRVAAIYTLAQSSDAAAKNAVAALGTDAANACFALRALTDREEGSAALASEPLVAALKADDARTRKGAIIGLGRLHGLTGVWADAALLKLAAKKVGAPEPREMAAKSLDAGWTQPQRRMQIIRAAALADDKSRAAQLVAALTDPDAGVARAAANAVKKLKIDPEKTKAATAAPGGPLISTMKVEDVLAQVTKTKGDADRGEQIFTQAACVACHTVKASEPPKGPFLGNIAQIYKRRELAEAILLPNKTIAQGFATNVFTLEDGSIVMGFVTQEAADKVVTRDIAGQERSIATADIARREKNDRSLMPEGLVLALTVHDFASLLDYLEGLAKR
jgi:putative heme-binding domain-containing protein